MRSRETAGSLDLKIAQLEHTLQVLAQQQVLSKPYPEHKVKLAERELQVQALLLRLLRDRAELEH
jgi:hypothetical protein